MDKPQTEFQDAIYWTTHKKNFYLKSGIFKLDITCLPTIEICEF